MFPIPKKKRIISKMLKAALNKCYKIKISIIKKNILTLTVKSKLLKKNKIKKNKVPLHPKKSKLKLKIMMMILEQNKNLKK